MRKLLTGLACLVCLLSLQLWTSLQAPARDRGFAPPQTESMFEPAQAVTKPVVKETFMTPLPQRPATFRAKVQGAHCLRDPSCPSGLGRVFCKTNDPESCEATGVCCAKAPPKRPPGPPICAVLCGLTPKGLLSCCPKGQHCCTEFNACCPNGTSCQSWFGYNFCFDNPF
jgi:hypothetical protein